MQSLFYSTGKKKTSVAKIWFFWGNNFNNKILVNGSTINKYFSRNNLSNLAIKPLSLIELLDNYNIIIRVSGGGLSSQANAIKHGIAKSLVLKNFNYKPKLREFGFITRDSRVVERKKFGLSGARKRYQHSKR